MDFTISFFYLFYDRVVAAQEEDSGMYICFAENPLGKILVQAIVTVQGESASSHASCHCCDSSDQISNVDRGECGEKHRYIYI